MIESRDDPWKSEPEEDVDGVWAGDVADGVVGILLIGGGRLAGEGVGQGSSESNERDGWINNFVATSFWEMAFPRMFKTY